MARKLTAKAIILNPDGKILILNNSYMPSRPRFAYKPDLPGGTAEAGESAEQALLREVREEIGIDLVAAPRRHINTYRLGLSGYDMALFLVWADIRDIELSVEHCMFSWLDIETVFEQAWWTGYKHVIRDVLPSLQASRLHSQYVRYTRAISYA